MGERTTRIVDLALAKIRPALEAGASVVDIPRGATDEQAAELLMRHMLEQLEELKPLLGG